MQEYEEFEFVIPAYTPETMPLDRLLQYLQQIGDVIGLQRDMHLVRVDESSTKPVFKIPTPLAWEVRERASSVQRGDGTIQQRNAYHRIRQMVRRDGGRPASLKDRSGVILDFPPITEAGPIVGVRQATAFDGELLRVGGGDDSYTPILMRGLAGEIQSGFTAPKSLAKAMAPYIFESIRVTGIGSWDRSPNGEWKLGKMLIQTYDKLDDDDLPGVFKRLRDAGVSWPDNADDVLLSHLLSRALAARVSC